jgi:hypothetical protein
LTDFQELCDRYAVKPTYLVTYDVIQNESGRETLQQLARGGNCEIGAHLHAWSTPPDYELKPGLFRQQPYLHEYPPEIQQQKLGAVTQTLTQAFGRRPTSYRGGRWSFDARAAEFLIKEQYLVDSTVTPGINWAANPGYSAGACGPSFVGAPPLPYRLAEADVTAVGTSPLVEVPVSIVAKGMLRSMAFEARRLPGGPSQVAALGRRALQKTGLRRQVWLRPGFTSPPDMMWVCNELCRQNAPVLNLMFHSSELLAGGSPRVRTPAAEREFWDSLERIIAYVTRNLGARGVTLTDHAQLFVEAGERVMANAR